MSKLDKFSLFTGIVGLFADTIAIGSFAASIGLFVIPNSAVKGSTNGTLLVTGIIGFYSLALIIWFLVRLERARKPAAMDELHELLESEGEDAFGILLVFIPLIGAFSLASYRSMRNHILPGNFHSISTGNHLALYAHGRIMDCVWSRHYRLGIALSILLIFCDSIG